MRYTVATRSTRLNVRSGPGVQFPKVGSCGRGDEVEVAYRQNGWGRLKRGGWASMRFLRAVAATHAAVPVSPSSQQRGTATRSLPTGSDALRQADGPLSAGPVGYSYYAARRGIALAPRHNRPERKNQRGEILPAMNDANGAFIPGARRFISWHESISFPRLEPFNNAHEVGDGGRSVARREVIEAIRRAPGPLSVIAYFGHGTRNGLPSAGIGPAHIRTLADAIRTNSTAHPVVLLYSCSAGSLRNGFAQRLQEAIGKGVVYSHSNSGHSFRNPFVTRFPESMYVVEPSSSLFRRWRNKLHAENLWLRFWMFSAERLHAALDSGVDTRRLVAR